MRRCGIWQGNDHYLHPAPRVAQFGAATRLVSKRQQTLAIFAEIGGVYGHLELELAVGLDGELAAGFEGGQMPIHMRLPKLRGFKNPFRVEYQVVNVGKLGELFPEGGKVTVEDLVAKHAVRDSAPVKVLGTGELSVKLEVEVDSWSSSAEAKITAAGGSISAR